MSTFSPGGITPVARDLFLLAIADGSLADPEVGLSRVARAFAIVDNWRQRPRYPSWLYNTDFDPDPDCGQRCDCPRVGGATWHDVVAQAIRDAATIVADDGAVTVARGADYGDARDPGFPLDWLTPGTPQTSVVGIGPLDEVGSHDTEQVTSEMLRTVAGLVDLLSWFGLSRSDDGGWVVPPTLREFAHAALQSTTF